MKPHRTCAHLLFVVCLARLLEFASGAQLEFPVTFREVSHDVGVLFHHVNGATTEKYMPETMGSGSLIFDYNDDGWPDIFLVNGGSLIDEKLARSKSALFRNDGNGNFRDVSAEAGIERPGYGMGACAADYDTDGYVDLYLTNFGSNALYRNNGDGTFKDVTAAAGVDSPLWSTSCAFSDIDKDGDLDLFVVSYVDFGLDNHKFCGDQSRGIQSYCHPNIYNGLPDVLFRNESDGTFTDVTEEAEIAPSAGNGMGIVFVDYDNDAWPDIFVANDSVPNFLYRNKGQGLFEETALWAGVAVASDSRPRAGMGTDFGDIDNDGLADVIVTNLSNETHNLFRSLGDGLFVDITYPSGVGEATIPFVGFGTAFLDYDNDGDQDLVIVNGDVLDNASELREKERYAQPNLLLRNDGGKFTNITDTAGPGFELVKVSRGLSVGDLDNDGDLDLLISNNGQTADVLRNEGGNRNRSILVRAIGTVSNRDGIGAKIEVTVGDKKQWREVRAGSSYESQSDLRVHFGLGQASVVDRLVVRWPSGNIDAMTDVEADQIITVVEGEGITGHESFPKPGSGAAKRR